MNRCHPLVLAVTSLSLVTMAGRLPGGEVEIVEKKGKAIVMIDGGPFTEYVFKGHSKPIFYPIVGPTGVSMTRNYPMREDVDNEAHDHPHHKSLWFTHDDVNGVRFWMEYPSPRSPVKPGKIVQTKMEIKADRIETENDWLSPEGAVVCRDVRKLGFGTSGGGRYIDFQITLVASHGDVTFGDTKEGTMGIRIHPLLRLETDEKRGNHSALGQAINSEGIRDGDVWGRRAKWVDYWAPIDGTTVGIAIFDHPDNPRHPTWWHARKYGLVAANPFGIHDFENKPEGTGNMTIPAGDSRTFRYRFLFHRGDHAEADIAGQYTAFAKDG